MTPHSDSLRPWRERSAIVVSYHVFPHEDKAALAALCPRTSTEPIEHTRMITIAIPTSEGRLHGHFGGCREFTLVQADSAQRKIISIRPVTPPPHAPGVLPRWLHKQGANVIIAGGIGRRALELFAQQDIVVCAALPDTSVEQLATAYLNGELTRSPDACTHHGHHHDHDHGHAEDNPPAP